MSYYWLVKYTVWAHLKWGLAMLYKAFINELQRLADTTETQVKKSICNRYYDVVRMYIYEIARWYQGEFGPEPEEN